MPVAGLYRRDAPVPDRRLRGPRRAAPVPGPTRSGTGVGREVTDMTTIDEADDHGRPLRLAVLAKQVPAPESLELGPDGRLRREGMALEMNPYCRRAVAKGVALSKASGGSCTAFTLGPPSAEEVLREAIAWGADDGVHLCDPAFAGSDTLATARALAAALRREGPFDLVLVGRSSIDGATGQVGPELAELLDVSFASGARRMRVANGLLHLGLEHEEGWEEVEVLLPALVSVAERLCAPCKVDPAARAAVPARRIRRLAAARLGEGPWGEAGSPTRVGSTRALHHRRERQLLSGDVRAQVSTALRLLAERGALSDPHDSGSRRHSPGRSTLLPTRQGVESPAGEPAPRPATSPSADRGVVAALVEPGRPEAAAELLGAAARLAFQLDGVVVALVAPSVLGARPGDHDVAASLGAFGADEALRFVSAEPGEALAAEDLAAALARWARERRPRVMLAPSTDFGCEVMARTAAALGAGLIGDAVTVDAVDGALVAGKSALSGALLAEIACTSPVQLATVRPGLLGVPPPAAGRAARVACLEARPRGRVRRRFLRQDEGADVRTQAEVVVGIGRGVHPSGYADVHALAKLLGAELVATRKVTDQGWLPRSRQVGITGRSISPRLYVAIGLSGALNHVLGVQGAGTVLAINADPSAPVFQVADVGIVSDWRKAVPLLISWLREARAVEHA